MCTKIETNFEGDKKFGNQLLLFQFLVRRELKKIRYVKGHRLTLYIQNVKLTTNFFSETCSSLLTLKIYGLEAKIVQESKSNVPETNPDQVDILQKIVSKLAYLKFLVTFSFENVHVYFEGTKFATASVSKADFYTESTRSGFLNLVTEIESADVQGKNIDVKMKKF